MPRRAGVEAARAAPAMLAVIRRRVGLELQAGQDHPEEHPAPMLATDEVGVLALPADSCGLRQRLLHDRRGVDEHLQLRRRLIDDEPRESLERLLDRLVIVAALRIGGDAPELGMGLASASGSDAGA